MYLDLNKESLLLVKRIVLLNWWNKGCLEKKYVCINLLLIIIKVCIFIFFCVLLLKLVMEKVLSIMNIVVMNFFFIKCLLIWLLILGLGILYLGKIVFLYINLI